MDPESPLTLDHGIPDPETFLPGTPPWVWWLVAAGVILILIALWFLVRHLNRSKPRPPALQKRNFYTTASQSLRALEDDCETKPLAEIAAHCSLAIRGYLAGSMSEPALYETTEEFQARQRSIPDDANKFLNELSDAKYSVSTINQKRASDFLARSQDCLTTLSNIALPPKEGPTNNTSSPPAMPPQPSWFRSRVASKSKSGILFGLILAIIGIFGGAYQRRGSGLAVEGNSLIWVGISISAVALVIHLISRRATSSS